MKPNHSLPVWGLKKALAANLIILAGLILQVTAVLAGEPRTMELTVQDQDLSMDFKRVPDARGHVLALGERKGTASLKGGQSATYQAFSIIDAWVGRKGIRKGYSVLTFKDGSQIFFAWRADSKRNQQNLPSLTGSGDITRGSGKYEGITGRVEFSGLQLKPTQQDPKRTRATEFKLSYTLPAKPEQAANAKRMELSITHQETRSQMLPSGGSQGHVLGIDMREGKARLKDGGHAEFKNIYTMEAWQGRKAVVWSNITLTFADGSWIFLKNTTQLTPDGSGRLKGQGRGEIVKGGGRFAGIKGSFETKAAAANASRKMPKGTRQVEAVLHYSLP